MTRSRDVADTQDNLGGAVAPFVAGKNFVINGGFDFFQRNAVSNASESYGLDRWFKISSGSGSNVSVTQQTAGVPVGSRYCMRTTMTGANGYGNQYQIIETSNVVPLQGKAITIAAKVRRNAAYAGNLTVSLEKSATVDGGMGATYTTISSQGVLNASIPTGTTSADWFTIQLTTTIPNDGTANTLRLGITQSQTESNCYWEVAQVQLELGSAATPFARAGGSIGGELALCQRYYDKRGGQNGTSTILNNALSNSAGTNAAFNFAINMRVAPTSVEFASLRLSDTSSGFTVNSVTLTNCTPTTGNINVATTGMTGFRSCYLDGSATGNFIAFSAEL